MFSPFGKSGGFINSINGAEHRYKKHRLERQSPRIEYGFYCISIIMDQGVYSKADEYDMTVKHIKWQTGY